jgi:hypothetical protein
MAVDSDCPETDEEAEMTVAMVVDNPEGSQEIYEKVRQQLGLEGPAGGIVHLAGPSPTGGWRVLEVWDSEEDAKRFREERLLPAFDAAGVPRPQTPPQIWQIHTYLK